MKSKNKVGDKTEPGGTPQLTGKEEEVAPSTSAELERSERKLDKSKQRERGNPKEGSLESSDSCHTRKKALDISRPTTQESPKSLRAEDHKSVRWESILPVDLDIRKTY